MQESHSLHKYLNKLVAFVVKWPGSDIDLLLTKPDGTALDYTGKTVFGYYEGKTQEYYVVYNDQPGTWQIDLKAVDVAEEGGTLRVHRLCGCRQPERGGFGSGRHS